MSENTPLDKTPATDTAPAPAATVAPAAAKAEAPAATKQPETPAPAPRRGKVMGVLADTILVLVLTAAIGGTGYYLKKQYDAYRVPTPMELVMKENKELCDKHAALRDKAFHADEQIHMRRRIAHLESRLGQDSQKIADLEASIAEQRNRVLAVQHEIRSADKEFRNVARTLLPGMAIGNATTTTGKAYPNAVIYRIDRKNIVLRTPEGQSRFPINQLVKDNLPTLARYAFGLETLVDMSDFDTVETLDAPVRETPAPDAKPADKPKPVSYEPEAGTPVVDTDAKDTTTGAEGDAEPAEQTDDGLAPW